MTMAAEAKVYSEFGYGGLSVGGFKIPDPEMWCISIKEMKDKKEIGSSVDKDAEVVGSTQIILSFPTENQMIAVLAAFTNQSFEVVDNKWKASQAIEEAQ